MIRIRASLILMLTALLLAAPASASAASLWKNLTGTTHSNLTTVSFARAGSTGSLHVMWAGPGTDPNNANVLYQRDVLASGALGPVHTVTTATGVGGFSQSPGFVQNPADGSFWVFEAVADMFEGRLIAMQSTDGTASWSPWSAISDDSSAYATFGLSAAFAADGSAYQAWRSYFKRTTALDPGEDSFIEAPGLNTNITTCCVYYPRVTVDGSTGAPYLAYFSNATDRSGIELVDVTSGAMTYVPGSASADRNSSENGNTITQVTGRIGAPGIYAAYCSVGPFCKQPLVWKAGTSKPVSLGRGSDVEDVTLSAAPGGRLWVSWLDNANKTVYARRSNTAATAWGATVSRPLPSKETSVYRMLSDGSAGYLDVFGHFEATDYSTWTTRFLPGLTITAAKATKKGAKLTVKVTDAGVPVAGAVVKLRGKSAKTNAAGVAKVMVVGGKGTGTVAATRGGYTAASAKVVVKL